MALDLNRTAGESPTNAGVTVAIIICTYSERRWEDLVASVASCMTQTRAADEVIVVVDHNATLLARAERAIDGVRVIESTGPPGLSGARNTGVSAARADVVAFLDDDAIAEPDWLERLCEPYADDDVLGVGGWIEPAWPVTRPRGFPPEFDWVIGCSYRGLPARRAPVRNLIGANMSLKRHVFAQVGGFRTSMGRVGNRPLGCEETELCIRVHDRWPQAELVFEPRARVSHLVAPERTHWRYFASRCYAEGLSKAAVVAYVGRSSGLASERNYALVTLPAGILRGVRRGDVTGLADAIAIVGGLALTSTGYLVGTAMGRFTFRRSGPHESDARPGTEDTRPAPAAFL